jgi:hypothetical protein
MSDAKNTSGNVGRDYEVGYGKPPKQTRFKVGQSGNPKGRPKGVRNFKTDLRATLKAPVKLMRDGRPRKVSTQEAMLLRLREKALGGDSRALDRLILLAQAYNNEELTAATGLPADDAKLLDIFGARILSGAVGRPQPANERTEGTSKGSRSRRSVDLGPGTESNTKRERVRLKRRCSSDEPEIAGEGDSA